MKRILLTLAMLFAFNQAQASVTPDAFFRPFVGTGQLLVHAGNNVFNVGSAGGELYGTYDPENGKIKYHELTKTGNVYWADKEGRIIALYNGFVSVQDIYDIALEIATDTGKLDQYAVQLSRLKQLAHHAKPTRIVTVTIDITNVFEAVPHNLTDGITHALSDIFDKVPDMMDKGEI